MMSRVDWHQACLQVRRTRRNMVCNGRRETNCPDRPPPSPPPLSLPSTSRRRHAPSRTALVALARRATPFCSRRQTAAARARARTRSRRVRQVLPTWSRRRSVESLGLNNASRTGLGQCCRTAGEVSWVEHHSGKQRVTLDECQIEKNTFCRLSKKNNATTKPVFYLDAPHRVQRLLFALA